MLRTCNRVRISGLPVLRNDGRGVAPAPVPPSPPLPLPHSRNKNPAKK
ncbi:MAG: hypothetical protein LBM98_10325 [Oscillospiraceae bacterium]|nr:hypothetical protein [Oscillospiraceae bacterium]